MHIVNNIEYWVSGYLNIYEDHKFSILTYEEKNTEVEEPNLTPILLDY